MVSLIIPLYKSEPNLDRLLRELVGLRDALLPGGLEVVFVNDGSPDACQEILSRRLPDWPVNTQLVELSRNFGSFSAIVAGLYQARGEYFTVLAADLQEPPELVVEFVRLLRSGEADVVFGVRASRSDPWLSELFSRLFWTIYRRYVVKDMPPGGVDLFGCNRAVRDRLLALPEVSTNLIALLFWVGFRRRFVPYHRRQRLEGKSAWTFRKKLRYCVDSIFNFTDLPMRVLLTAGWVGTVLAIAGAVIVLWAKLRGNIEVPGYTPVVLAVMFFGGLTTFGIGVLGQYLWLTLQNARSRPNFIIRTVSHFRSGEQKPHGASG